MKAGVLGVVDGTFTVVDSFTEAVTEDGHELERCLTIDRVFSLPSGEMAFEGRAAADAIATETATTIETGDIYVDERERTVTRFAEFVGIPGSSSSSTAVTGPSRSISSGGRRTRASSGRRSISTSSSRPGRSDAVESWFYGPAETDVNGVFHGADLRDEMGDVLETSSLNQIGLSYEHDGDDVKMTATRSGYVELYRPASFDSAEFLEYIRDEILPSLE